MRTIWVCVLSALSTFVLEGVYEVWNIVFACRHERTRILSSDFSLRFTSFVLQWYLSRTSFLIMLMYFCSTPLFQHPVSFFAISYLYLDAIFFSISRSDCRGFCRHILLYSRDILQRITRILSSTSTTTTTTYSKSGKSLKNLSQLKSLCVIETFFQFCMTSSESFLLVSFIMNINILAELAL